MKKIVLLLLFLSASVSATYFTDPYRFTATYGFDGVEFAPTIWLDASDISTLWQTDDCSTTAVTTDGDTVECWQDKSSNALQFTNATSTNTYETSEINGNPIIQFGGVGLRQYNISMYDIVDGTDSSFTMFAVMYIPVQSYDYLFWHSNEASDKVGLRAAFWTPNIAFESSNNTTARAEILSPASFNTSPKLVMMRRDGTTDLTIRIDCVDEEVDTTVSGNLADDATDDIVIGSKFAGGAQMVGQLPFFIMYKGALGAGDIAHVESLLNERYDICP